MFFSFAKWRWALLKIAIFLRSNSRSGLKALRFFARPPSSRYLPFVCKPAWSRKILKQVMGYGEEVDEARSTPCWLLYGGQTFSLALDGTRLHLNTDLLVAGGHIFEGLSTENPDLLFQNEKAPGCWPKYGIQFPFCYNHCIFYLCTWGGTNERKVRRNCHNSGENKWEGFASVFLPFSNWSNASYPILLIPVEKFSSTRKKIKGTKRKFLLLVYTRNLLSSWPSTWRIIGYRFLGRRLTDVGD